MKFLRRTSLNSPHCDQEDKLEFLIEPLESRQLLAGNVTAAFTNGGDLRINGDALSNDIQISTVVPGTVSVTGSNGTTVNGDASVTFSLANFGGSLPDDVIVNMRAGDDSVVVGEIGFSTFISDQLVINGGSGNDDVGIYQVVASDVRLVGGRGNEMIAIVGASINDSLNISTAGGNDAVYVDCSFASNFAKINMGAGEDGVFFASAANRLDIRTGGGNDLVTLGNTLLGVTDGRFFLGGGDDLLAASDAASFTVNPVNGGAGTDTVMYGIASGFQDRDLNVESNILTNDANTTTVASVLAFHAEWSNRGNSPLIFVC